MPEEITLRGGKYKFYMDERGVLCCDRYDTKIWRDFVGDNAVLALFRECLDLRKELAEQLEAGRKGLPK